MFLNIKETLVKIDILIERCLKTPYHIEMDKKLENKIKKLGVFDLEKALEFGLEQQRISDLVKEEKLLRISRGLYMHPEAKITAEIEFEIAAAKLGEDCVIGGLTALFYYGLIEQVPQQTWVLVAPSKKTSSDKYRLIRSKVSLEVGVVNKGKYKIVSIERALVEGLKLSTKIGERTALSAIRKALSEHSTSFTKLNSMANKLGMSSVVDKYFEILAA